MSIQNHTCLRKINGIVVWATAAFGMIASLMATQLPAETANSVTLETFDGSSSISGEMIDVDGDFYRIRTLAGVIEVSIQTVVCIGEACPILVAEYVVGEEVTLTLKDGSANVTGEVLLSTDTDIAIDSDLLGPVAFNRSDVICSGPNCHFAPAEKSTASIIESLLNGTEN